MLEMLWTFMVVHPIFINVSIHLWILLTSRILVSCSLLPFCACFLIYFSCGNDTCGTYTLCLLVGTNAGIANGAILPFIILCACAFVHSYFFLTPNHEAPHFSTLFFLLRSFLGDFFITFSLFSNAACISSLVLLTLACGFSFW